MRRYSRRKNQADARLFDPGPGAPPLTSFDLESASRWLPVVRATLATFRELHSTVIDSTSLGRRRKRAR